MRTPDDIKSSAMISNIGYEGAIIELLLDIRELLIKLSEKHDN